MPAVFIRFAGCNLQCPWCDTSHDVRRKMSPEDIVTEIYARWPIDYRKGNILVVLTGGEPTIHNLVPLLELIRKNVDIEIALETNGTAESCTEGMYQCYNDGLIDYTIISPKSQQPPTEWILTKASEIKVVLDGVIDPRLYEFPARTELLHYIQPCSENFEPAVDFVLKHPNWVLSVQIQKVVGVR